MLLGILVLIYLGLCLDLPKLLLIEDSAGRIAFLKSSLLVISFRVFVATWNVGGKPPHDGLNPEDFLHVDDSLDLYVLGYGLFSQISFKFM